MILYVSDFGFSLSLFSTPIITSALHLMLLCMAHTSSFTEAHAD
jgi:hypothetical protein